MKKDLNFPISVGRMLVLIGVLSFLIEKPFAQEVKKLKHHANNGFEHFGWASAIKGDWMALSTPYYEVEMGKRDAGVVKMYRLEGDKWTQTQTLIDPEGVALDNFGYSIALHHGLLVVGAIGTFENGPYSGSALVYEFNGKQWQLKARLRPSDPKSSMYFGHSSATNGKEIAISSIRADGKSEESGAVYVFRKNDFGIWAFATKLQSSDGRTHDKFGTSVAMNEMGEIAVGAPYADGAIEKSGAVYMFSPSQAGDYSETRLVHSNATTRDYFGSSVALDRNHLIIGAFMADGKTNNDGCAFHFVKRNNRWSQAQILEEPVGKLNDQFGKSLALSDDRLLIGAPKSDYGADSLDVGSVYFYKFDSGRWLLQDVLTSPSPVPHAGFGYTLSIDRRNLAVSALSASDAVSSNAGAVFVTSVSELVTGINPQEMVGEFELIAYPNPSYEEVTIRYELRASSEVGIVIYDLQGRLIKELLRPTFQSLGRKEIVWNLRSDHGALVNPGLYLYTLNIGGNQFSRRLMVR